MQGAAHATGVRERPLRAELVATGRASRRRDGGQPCAMRWRRIRTCSQHLGRYRRHRARSVRRAEHGVRWTTAPSSMSAGASWSSSRFICCSSPTGGEPADDASAQPDRRRRREPGDRSSRTTSAGRRRRYFTNAVTEIVAGENAQSSITTSSSAKHRDAFNIATLRMRAGAQRATFASHSISLGGALVRNDVNAGAGRRRRRVPDQRPVHRRAARSMSTTTRSSTTPARTAAAASFTRASSTARARRLQRPDHRPQGRAEDRRQADQP